MARILPRPAPDREIARGDGDVLHRRLKASAALPGMSLSDFLLNEISEVAERPTIEELCARLKRRSPATPSVTSAVAVRAERGRK